VDELPPSDTQASSPGPLLSFPPEADVLVDRIQFGIDILMPMPASEGERFCSRLYQLGILPKMPRPGQWQRDSLPVLFVVDDLPDEGTMAMKGDLVLRPEQNERLRVTNRSQLRPGLLRALRSQLREPGEAATGGATNLVGAHGPHWQHFLDRELANLGHGIDAFMSALAKAAEVPFEQLRGRLWVQQCEIYRDLPDSFASAEQIVNHLAQRPLMSGAKQTIRPIRDGTLPTREHDGDRLVVRWHEDTDTAPIRKAYAKRPELLRTEIELRDRPSVKALLAKVPGGAPKEDTLSGDEAASVVAALAQAAVPLLDDMWRTAYEFYDVYPRGGTEFLLGLVPLLRLIVPDPRSAGAVGRPAGEATPQQARRALETLIMFGRCETTTRGTSERLREALAEMEQNGLLRRANNKPALFAVRPEYEDVRQALRSAPRRDDRIDEHLET
jgi:hypothetical protein